MFFFIARTTRNYVYLYMLYMYCTNSNTVVLFFYYGDRQVKVSLFKRCLYLRGIALYTEVTFETTKVTCL